MTCQTEWETNQVGRSVLYDVTTGQYRIVFCCSSQIPKAHLVYFRSPLRLIYGVDLLPQLPFRSLYSVYIAVNPLHPARSSNLKDLISEFMSQFKFTKKNIWEIVLGWNLFDDKSTSVQLTIITSRCWLTLISPYGINMPQRVNTTPSKSHSTSLERSYILGRFEYVQQ